MESNTQQSVRTHNCGRPIFCEPCARPQCKVALSLIEHYSRRFYYGAFARSPCLPYMQREMVHERANATDPNSVVFGDEMPKSCEHSRATSRMQLVCIAFNRICMHRWHCASHPASVTFNDQVSVLIGILRPHSLLAGC